MAKKKAKKTKKPVKKAAKAKKAAKKPVRKTAKKAAKKTAKKATKKKTPAAKAAPRKAVKAKKKTPSRKKQIVGEGDYAATRAFDRDQAAFVKAHKAEIPALGQAAEKALDGPEGELLRAAEATAAARSRDTF